MIPIVTPEEMAAIDAAATEPVDVLIGRAGAAVARCARQMLGEEFQELRRDIVAIWDRRNAADDGTFRLAQEYLVSVVSF